MGKLKSNKMNLDNVLFHLKEAKGELNRTIAEIEKTKDYGQGEFIVAMSHLYHHLNTAWNSRNVTMEEVETCTDQNFNKWRKFPRNDELLLD